MDAKRRRKLLYDCPKHELVDQIAELEAQFARARKLLETAWAPVDHIGYPCEDWAHRRDALLGEESE